MRIPAALCDDLLAHAAREAPLECCGLIACHGDDAARVYPILNAAASEYRYELDGAQQFRAQADIEAHGLTVGAIYHSHTHAPPFPSESDVALAAHPELLYVIIGGGEVRAFAIRDQLASEVPLILSR